MSSLSSIPDCNNTSTLSPLFWVFTTIQIIHNIFIIYILTILDKDSTERLLRFWGASSDLEWTWDGTEDWVTKSSQYFVPALYSGMAVDSQWWKMCTFVRKPLMKINVLLMDVITQLSTKQETNNSAKGLRYRYPTICKNYSTFSIVPVVASSAWESWSMSEIKIPVQCSFSTDCSSPHLTAQASIDDQCNVAVSGFNDLNWDFECVFIVSWFSVNISRIGRILPSCKTFSK